MMAHTVHLHDNVCVYRMYIRSEYHVHVRCVSVTACMVTEKQGVSDGALTLKVRCAIEKKQIMSNVKLNFKRIVENLV